MKRAHQNSKIRSQHLDRTAVVYLRQSSEKQVQQNRESQHLQYSLVSRAQELGFQHIDVIDTDLGSSASIGSSQRVGFERLISSVALGEVGIVFSREVSRLSRTDKDWCQLLEVCQLFGTLIGDADQIYDLNLIDDQLILGIKGTMSVVELKVLQMRMLAGQESKARRGELMMLLPPGYVYDAMDKVVKDPDIRVQESMEMIFQKFRSLWSVRQTFLWFRTQDIELPVNKSKGGRMKIVWQAPTYSFIKDVLTNPFYAGAYFYGRRQTETKLEDGMLLRRQGKICKPEEYKVLIRDHHEGYIDWDTYENNVTRIRANSLKLEKDESVAPVRAGQGILVGIMRCGRCGRKLHVRYWGKSGTAARYVCKGDFDTGGRYCLAFGGSTVDRRFGQELLNVISPFGIRASLEAIRRLNCQDEERKQALVRQIQQMEYETKRAFEQYNEVDPRNRLVAAELERRWNVKLDDLEKLKSALSEMDNNERSLTEKERDALMALGENFATVWDNGNCPAPIKKKIIRTVIHEVIVKMNDKEETLIFIINWKGGTHTQFEIPKPSSGVGQKTSIEDIEIIRRMGIRYGDDEIARVLNKLSRRTGTGKRWNEQRIASVRRRYSIPGQKRSTPDPEILTLGRAAKYCNVSQTTIKHLVASGILKKEQMVPWAPWEIKRSDLDSEKIRQIIDHLHQTGKLVLEGDDSVIQGSLFQQNQCFDKGGYYE